MDEKNQWRCVVASSFVKQTNKLSTDSGSGEAKLFVGSKKNEKELLSFFNDFSDDNNYYFEKDDVVDYLKKVFLEYKYNCFQVYKNVNEKKYNENIDKLSNEYRDKNKIELKLEVYSDKNRVYVRSNPEKEYKDNWDFIVRQIALPKITQVVFEKLNNTNFRLHFCINAEKAKDKDNGNVNEVTADNISGINRIYYGAPGTGKSYNVSHKLIKKYITDYNETIGSEFVFRTTLYPDYSYADFVGHVQPTVKKDDTNDSSEVTYEFKPGIFTSALYKAINNPLEPVFLVLEELSRCDVSSVFGDVFQLLDREENGKSCYGINNDLMANFIYGNKDEKIFIPNNLFIIGTMNTSDQNVFVMDTAFKRRFEWKHISINDEIETAKKNNNPEIQTGICNNFDKDNWCNFIRLLNKYIINRKNGLGLTEDKQIGPYFIKFNNSDESRRRELMSDKLLFYLWEDCQSASFQSDNQLFDESINSLAELIDTYKEDKSSIYSDEFVNFYVNESSGSYKMNEVEDDSK